MPLCWHQMAMEDTTAMCELERIRWSPKVRQELIRRVYESEALGILDEELIDDLGLRLLLRCRSVVRAMCREVECPRCHAVFRVEEHEVSPQGTACPSECGWSVTGGEFRESKRDRDLNGADNVTQLFALFVEEYPRCTSAREKLLSIDRLIHQFHYDSKLDVPGRSASNNLIEGKHKQVIQFLDDLSAPDPRAKAEWREAVGVMWKRRRGQLNLP